MPYPRNDLIQYAIVDYLKNNAATSDVRDQLSDTDEIREDQWQGTAFSYPAIRVRMIMNKPRVEQSDCRQRELRLAVQVFSEEDSSQQCDRIAGIIDEKLHARQFTSQSIHLTLWTINLSPARRIEGQNVWIAETIMKGTASG